MITLISKIVLFIKGSTFFWKLISNYSTLKNSFISIQYIIEEIKKDQRTLPNAQESQLLLKAFSNILKTKVIDIDGLDEYEIALFLDEVSGKLQVSLEDSISKKPVKFIIDTQAKEVKYV